MFRKVLYRKTYPVNLGKEGVSEVHDFHKFYIRKRANMRNKKIFLFCLNVSIIFSALSISISQGFLFLSLLFFLIDKREKKWVNPVSILGFLLFASYLASSVYHSFTLGMDEGLKLLPKSEFKDIILFFGFFLTLNLDSYERKRVMNSFQILILLLVITGLVSIFTEVRLAVRINELFREIKTWRFTHHYGDILNIRISVPIGLMNTHLTFGGLLAFFFPYLIFTLVFKLKTRGLKHSIPLIIFLTVLSIIILLNNARSAMFGIFFSLCFGTLDTVWNREIISKKRILKLATYSFSFMIILVSILYFNDTTSKTIKPLLGAEKHTDSGRTFIWNSSFPMILKNPIFGVGPGRYDKENSLERKNLSEEKQELAFFYQVSQTGHAHNDYFHLATVSGIPTAIIFILILFFIMKELLSKNHTYPQTAIFYGLVGFFFASTLQCYFQDDEVVILFWYLCGLLFNKRENEEKTIQVSEA
ncbi:MAG: O-antigen ligase family protein [Leptospiraceae bacterium]|nr:O-antigen ligase family protein [Leptospiraceae bacterium]